MIDPGYAEGTSIRAGAHAAPRRRRYINYHTHSVGLHYKEGHSRSDYLLVIAYNTFRP